MRSRIDEMGVIALVIILLFLVFHVIVISYDEPSSTCPMESK